MLLALGLAALGLIVGPLLGIVIDRAVERETLAPVLRCPECATDLGPPIPLQRWFGACPTDPAHARWRYPATDLLTAATFFLAGWRFETSFQLIPYLVAFAALVVLIIIDFETHLLPNIITYPLMAAIAFAVLVMSGPNNFQDGLWPALIGGAVFGGFLLVAFIAYPPGLGLGDVKLAPSLGMLLGWLTAVSLDAIRLPLYAMLIGMVSGALYGLTARTLFRRRSEEDQQAILEKQRSDWIPGEVAMGPFLILGTLVMIAVTTPAVLS